MAAVYSKAYNPLGCKTTGVGANTIFCVGDTNMLVSKNAIICLTPNEKHKICVSPNANPQRVGHVHFIYVDVDFIRVGSRFSVEYGLKLSMSFYGSKTRLI